MRNLTELQPSPTSTPPVDQPHPDDASGPAHFSFRRELLTSAKVKPRPRNRLLDAFTASIPTLDSFNDDLGPCFLD